MVGCRRTGGRQPCKGASNRSSGSTRQGDLRATYDATGNLTELRVDRDGTCIPSGKCSQVFRYQWDEVGRLVTAKRWDAASLDVTSTADPVGVADVELHYAYDASDMRVSKRAVDTQGEESNTLYIFGSLELRRTVWNTQTQDYALNPETEVAYLFANGVRLARLAYEAPGDVPSIGGETLHVFFELGDHLGSTSVVLDKATGELVERSTYQAYGGSESDYRPERWKHFREDYRFTGKEEDVEVGLIYFGKRFLNPLLNRWVSADPLAVHGLGADPNLYAYVSGRALQAVDPLGLEDTKKQDPKLEKIVDERVPKNEYQFEDTEPIVVKRQRTPEEAEDDAALQKAKADRDNAKRLFEEAQREYDALDNQYDREERTLETWDKAKCFCPPLVPTPRDHLRQRQQERVWKAESLARKASQRMDAARQAYKKADSAYRATQKAVNWRTAARAWWRKLAEKELKAPSGWFSKRNLKRMAEGKAAQMRVLVKNRKTGQVMQKDVSLELHHKFLPQRSGSKKMHQEWNLEMANRWAHEGMDKFRHAGWDVIKVIKGPNSF